jgi:hypothetical protein
MLKSSLDEAKASIQQKLKNDLFITHIINFLMMHNASPQLIVTNPWDAYPEYVLPFVFDHIHNHHHNVTQNAILDINAQNDCGDTPLHEVIGYEIVPGYQPFGKLKTLCLLELGADTTLKNKKGETPFDRAQGDKKMEKLLSESSVRSIQMPFYKKNVQKNLAVTRHGKSQNLHNKINNRALGFK